MNGYILVPPDTLNATLRILRQAGFYFAALDEAEARRGMRSSVPASPIRKSLQDAADTLTKDLYLDRHVFDPSGTLIEDVCRYCGRDPKFEGHLPSLEVQR